MILGFHGLLAAAGQGVRGFDGGWPLVNKSHVKSLVSPTMTKFDR